MSRAARRAVGQLAASRLDLPGTTNVRDLAGYPGAPGTIVGAGRLLRGEVLAHPGGNESQGVFDEAAAESFAALAVVTVVDLRSESEAARTPSAWQAATGAREVVEVRIAEGGEGVDTSIVQRLLSGELDNFSASDMTAFYCNTLDRSAALFAMAIEVLADPGRLPALVHCSAGKDRTGLLVALVLEVLGTPREIVVEDYTLTEQFRPNRIDTFAPLFVAAGVDPERGRALFSTPPESMRRALEYLDVTWGGASDYLVRAGGLEPMSLDRLRASMLVVSQNPSSSVQWSLEAESLPQPRT